MLPLFREVSVVTGAPGINAKPTRATQERDTTSQRCAARVRQGSEGTWDAREGWQPVPAGSAGPLPGTASSPSSSVTAADSKSTDRRHQHAGQHCTTSADSNPRSGQGRGTAGRGLRAHSPLQTAASGKAHLPGDSSRSHQLQNSGHSSHTGRL